MVCHEKTSTFYGLDVHKHSFGPSSGTDTDKSKVFITSSSENLPPVDWSVKDKDMCELVNCIRVILWADGEHGQKLTNGILGVVYANQNIVVPGSSMKTGMYANEISSIRPVNNWSVMYLRQLELGDLVERY